MIVNYRGQNWEMASKADVAGARIISKSVMYKGKIYDIYEADKTEIDGKKIGGRLVAKDSKSGRVLDKAIKTLDYKEGEHEGSWLIKIGNDTFELWGEYGARRGNYAKNLTTGETKKLSGAVGTRQKAYVTIAKAFRLA